MKVGEIIWRPVKVVDGLSVIPGLPIKREGGGAAVFRVQRGALHTKSADTLHMADERGFVCFCKQDVPEEVGCFQVTHVGERSALVEPVVCSLDDILRRYATPAQAKDIGAGRL